MSIASPLELEMLTLINAERAEASLEPLTLNTRLSQAAEDHSAWMLEANVFDHSGEGGSSPSARMEAAGYPFEPPSLAAENIGWQSERGEDGYSDDVEMIHNSLMLSPGHRANMLDADATEIGIGIEVGDFTIPQGTFEAVMITQNFATTAADTSDWRDPGTAGQEVEPAVVEEDEDIVAEAEPPVEEVTVAEVELPDVTDDEEPEADDPEVLDETDDPEPLDDNEEPVLEQEPETVDVADPLEDIVTAFDDLDFDFQEIEGAVLFVFDWDALFAQLNTFWDTWLTPAADAVVQPNEALTSNEIELPADEFVFECA